jgi:hypothetical protein
MLRRTSVEGGTILPGPVVVGEVNCENFVPELGGWVRMSEMGPKSEPSAILKT